MARWFRIYDDCIDDPKIGNLPDALFRAWFSFLCVSSRFKGKIPDNLKDLAHIMRMSESDVANALTNLQMHGLVDKISKGYEPHNWKQRQFVSDVSTERVKQFRKRQRNVSLGKRPQRQSTETDTETDKTILVSKLTEFETFWDQYPKKVARRAAERAYRAALSRATPEQIQAGLQSYRKQMDGKEAQYIAHAATWLNADRWADEAGTSTGLGIVVDMSAFNSPEELEGQRKAMERYGIKQAV